jgi:hypothetical protein
MAQAHTAFRFSSTEAVVVFSTSAFIWWTFLSFIILSLACDSALSMAVLDELPGLEVQIIVNRTPVKEYDDDEEEVVDKTVTRYIEAESEAEFEVRLKFQSMFNISAKHSVAAEVLLDGKYGNGVVL